MAGAGETERGAGWSAVAAGDARRACSSSSSRRARERETVSSAAARLSSRARISSSRVCVRPVTMWSMTRRPSKASLPK